MARSRADQLKSLKMPAKSMAENEAGDDLAALGEEGSPEEEASESPDEEKAEKDRGAEETSGPLADASDDELIAEMRSRGLLEEENEPGEGKEEVLAPGPKHSSQPGPAPY